MEIMRRMEERKRKVKIISHHLCFMVMVVMVSYNSVDREDGDYEEDGREEA
jgi:hypothetical protein